ncbi:MAG: alpha-ribazole phosphatase [Peptococcaceae bacterium]
MTKIIFVRHGETEWNDTGKYQGHTDIPLSQTGLEQAVKVSLRLANERIAAVYSSDLLRARQTAELIAVRHNLSVRTRAEFREINFGVWEGKTFKEINHLYPDLLKTWLEEPEKLIIPEGETFQQLTGRTFNGLSEIQANHEGETIVVVAHGGTIGAVMCSVLEIKLNNLWKIKQGNTGISIIEFHDNKGILTLFNDTLHLNIS